MRQPKVGERLLVPCKYNGNHVVYPCTVVSVSTKQGAVLCDLVFVDYPDEMLLGVNAYAVMRCSALWKKRDQQGPRPLPAPENPRQCVICLDITDTTR